MEEGVAVFATVEWAIVVLDGEVTSVAAGPMMLMMLSGGLEEGVESGQRVLVTDALPDADPLICLVPVFLPPLVAIYVLK